MNTVLRLAAVVAAVVAHMRTVLKVIAGLAILILAMIAFTPQVVGVVGLFIAWAGAVFFPPYYHFTSRWQSNPIGPHLMGYSIAMALALTNTVARVMWPNLPWRVEIGVVLMWFIVWVIYWRIIVFIKIRNRYRRNKVPHEGEVAQPYKTP